jgi:hypothetical protein
MKMRARKGRRGLLSLGLWLLGSLVLVDAVKAQGGIPFFVKRDFGVGDGPGSVTVGDFNGDGRQDLATANGFADTVSVLINTPGMVVNNLVSFEPITATFQFTPDPTGCPPGFVGTFSFEARLTNTSDSSLTDLVTAVNTLTNGNLRQNADGGPRGVGALLTVPQQDGFTDGVLSPEELIDVLFRICLTQPRPFQFVVDVAEEVE